MWLERCQRYQPLRIWGIILTLNNWRWYLGPEFRVSSECRSRALWLCSRPSLPVSLLPAAFAFAGQSLGPRLGTWRDARSRRAPPAVAEGRGAGGRGAGAGLRSGSPGPPIPGRFRPRAPPGPAPRPGRSGCCRSWGGWAWAPRGPAGAWCCCGGCRAPARAPWPGKPGAGGAVLREPVCPPGTGCSPAGQRWDGSRGEAGPSGKPWLIAAARNSPGSSPLQAALSRAPVAVTGCPARGAVRAPVPSDRYLRGCFWWDGLITPTKAVLVPCLKGARLVMFFFFLFFSFNFIFFSFNFLF